MADTQEALLPCPFCGCRATFVKHSAGVPQTRGFDSWDAVACKHCRATVGASDRRFRSRDDARDAWNRRALSASSAPQGKADGWMPIETAPKDGSLMMLAAEFDRPGDWRKKVGGYWDGEWNVFGASWIPTRWMPLPPDPLGSDKAAAPAQEANNG